MDGEQVPLLPVVARNANTRTSQPRCLKTSCCIRSKSARLILLWNFAVLLGFKMFGDANIVMQVTDTSVATVILYVLLSIIAVFSPIAGLLTDVKFSRYKVVACTSCAIIAELLISPFITAVDALLSDALYETHINLGVRLGLSIIYPFAFLGAFVITVVIFMINALQFGMDQLHDSPTEDSILFIHWYVWISHAVSLLTTLAWNLTFHDIHHIFIGTPSYIGLSLFLSLLVISLVLLIASLCIYQRRKLWFLLEPAGANPYKLVYRVVKFAYQHKVPLRRSAFTYCGEEFPSRMDLGKRKYGGPFTGQKQVEDVKAFWGILKVVVLHVSPVFYTSDVAMQSSTTFFC